MTGKDCLYVTERVAKLRVATFVNNEIESHINPTILSLSTTKMPHSCLLESNVISLYVLLSV